ncbi:TPA: hypothetical protein I7778_21785 [Vibrio vulnificus]|nr:hypothetical protein [Vibrio vulnificus]
MFNHVKSVDCIFSLLYRLSNFGFVGKLTSVFAVFCFLFSGLQFVGAKNSESYLIKAQCICESNKAS